MALKFAVTVKKSSCKKSMKNFNSFRRIFHLTIYSHFFRRQYSTFYFFLKSITIVIANISSTIPTSIIMKRFILALFFYDTNFIRTNSLQAIRCKRFSKHLIQHRHIYILPQHLDIKTIIFLANFLLLSPTSKYKEAVSSTTSLYLLIYATLTVNRLLFLLCTYSR